MNTFNSIGNRALTPALLAVAAGLYSTATPATNSAFFLEKSSALMDRHIAFSVKKRSVFRNNRKLNQCAGADPSRPENTLDAVTDAGSATR